MKVLIFLAAWKRPEITEICFIGINRLKNAGLFQLDTMCVISEEEMIPLCYKHGINWTFYKNDPLGEKKNAGLNAAMKLDWDYLIEIGSDDVLKNEILEAYKPFMEAGEDLFGIKDFLYINSEDGRCRRLKSNTTYGAARCISRKAIEDHCFGHDVIAHVSMISGMRSVAKGHKGFFKVEDAKQLEGLGRVTIIGEPRYRLWKDEINRGLDNNSNFMLETSLMKAHKTVPTKKALGIDIKSQDNIWAFNPSIGVEFSLEEALEGLSIEEQSRLLALMKKRHFETQVLV